MSTGLRQHIEIAGIQGDDTVDDQTTGRPASKRRQSEPKDRESWIERGVAIRAGFYIFGTHLFAGFVWLLFYLGEHAHK
ncbi:DUF6126 family protein [Streptomyces sp. NPDC015532]|jgi:hypothetical protein|uniref:DUF6126 family protein n=1 Tax=unclassified Streptomyces TaxID=2593676 RepID=UPI003701BEB8